MSKKLLLPFGAFVAICLAVFSFSFPDHTDKALTEELPDETRFSVEVLGQKLFEPMQLAITPENKVIYIERRGAIKLYDPKLKTHRIIANLDVYFGSEDGLLGMALDPEYEKNKWIYFFYSPAGKPLAKGEKAPVGAMAMQRVSRFTMFKDSLLMKSEKLILEIPVIRACCHSGGSVEFGPDRNLFISTGDNTNPSASEGYSPIDERAERLSFDAQKSAANTHDLRGKILRIKPTPEGSYTIPEGNLFPKDGSKGKPEIYIMGDRNPWRISIDQKTGYLYWGEIGPDAGVDSAHRGPRGYDEVNQARKAGNFGWPYFIGPNIPYMEYNFDTKVSGKPFDPAASVNNSVNNTGSKILPLPQPAFIWYPYADSPEFPEVGKGARTSMAGPVFYKDQFKKGTETFPPYYEGKLFIYEWSRSWIKTVTMDPEGNFKSMEPFMPNSLLMSKPCDMAFGPDGSLYVLEYGNYWKSINDDSRLIKIKYHANNRRPVAKATADKLAGAVPLKVNFSAAGSLDYDKGDQISYTWKLKDGRILSKDSVLNYSFTKPGIYNVKLLVTDKKGEISESALEIKAGNEPPMLTIETNDNRSFYWNDQAFNYSIKVKDREDGIIKEGNKNVQVLWEYLAEGKDQILLAPVNSANKEVTISSKGKTLIGASDCKACHAPDKRTVGPGFMEIAQRYKGKNVTLELVNKVRNGGSGKWGEVPMAAHPQVSKEDATQMVKYILSLAEVKKTNYLPMTGTLKTKKQQSKEGVYYFTASYTDKGANAMKALTARETIVLRNAYIPAYNYDSSRNIMNKKVEQKIQFAQDSAYISFNNIDLTNIKSITVKGGSGNKIDGTLEIRSGSDNGPLISSKFLPSGGGMKNYEFPVNSSGFQDLYFVFRTDTKIGMFAPFDIISVTFNK